MPKAGSIRVNYQLAVGQAPNELVRSSPAFNELYAVLEVINDHGLKRNRCAGADRQGGDQGGHTAWSATHVARFPFVISYRFFHVILRL